MFRLKHSLSPAIMTSEGLAMTAKEAIVQAVDDLPEDYLDDLAHYVETLRQRAAMRTAPTALASEAVLGKDWLRSEEEEAWRDL